MNERVIPPPRPVAGAASVVVVRTGKAAAAKERGRIERAAPSTASPPRDDIGAMGPVVMFATNLPA